MVAGMVTVFPRCSIRISAVSVDILPVKPILMANMARPVLLLAAWLSPVRQSAFVSPRAARREPGGRAPVGGVSLLLRLRLVPRSPGSAVATIDQIRVIGNRRIPRPCWRAFFPITGYLHPISIEREFTRFGTGYFGNLRIRARGL